MGFPGANFATLSAAIASLIPLSPLSQPIVIEVHASAPVEAITIPAGVIPTALNPLTIWALRHNTVANPLPGEQSESGSMFLYPPPQPRLVPPVMSSLLIQAPYVQFDGFKIAGSVTVSSNLGVILSTLRVEGGQILITRVVPTAVACLIKNTEIVGCTLQSAVKIVNAQGVQLYHNSVLQRHSDAASPALPSYALEVQGGTVDVRNNIWAAAGPDAFAVRFVGPPAGSTFTGNFYAAFDGARGFSYSSSILGPFSVTDDPNAWKSTFMASESGGLAGDPIFRDRLSSLPDLDVSNASPTIAATNAISGVRNDIRSERRAIDFVTMGAHDHAEVITDTGRVRFLQLLAGISMSPVSQAVLSNVVTAVPLSEFPARSRSVAGLSPLFNPVPIDGVNMPGTVGREGEIIFKASFQVTEENYVPLQNPIVQRANEIALLAGDGTPFLVKRMHSIPFDSCAFMHQQLQVPVEVVS